MNFSSYAFLMAITLGAVAYILAILSSKKPELWKTLPRERVIGVIIGTLCLFVVKGSAELMLEGGLAKFRPYLLYAIPVIAVGSYFFLDFVFMRAMGGVLILLSCQLLDSGMTEAVPARALVSLMAYFWGIVGLFLLGMPWIGRNIIEKSTLAKPQRMKYSTISLASAVVFLIFSVIGLI